MKKEIIEAEIVRNTEIAKGVYQMTILCGDVLSAANPGQFINLYLNDKSMLLPRPFSLCRKEQEKAVVVYRVTGRGTCELSGYGKGDRLRISPPLGRGYDLEAVFRELKERLAVDPPSGAPTIALVAGGLGVPPLLGLAETLRKEIFTFEINRENGHWSQPGIQLIAVLGFREEPFLVEDLRQYCDEVLVATEKGTEGLRGSVLDLLIKEGVVADYYLACGPKLMLKALSGLCAGLRRPLQVSLGERMGCGYGACVGCTCKTKEKDSGLIQRKKVCLDGPVFLGEEVVWDE